MRKYFLILCLLWGYISSFGQLPNSCPELNGDVIFINEIHYDNTGQDVNEGIEIAGPAGTDLSNYRITRYNGRNGVALAPVQLAGFIPNEKNGFGTLFIPIINNNGNLQNDVDGIALFNIQEGRLVQFLSYEGTFVAVGGDADGLTSDELPVVEAGNTPVGFSLQLSNGAGFCPSAFEWVGPIPHTKNAENTNQFFEDATATDVVFVDVPTSCVQTDELFEIKVCFIDSTLGGGVRDVSYDTPITLDLNTGDQPNTIGLPQTIDPASLRVFDGCATFAVGYTDELNITLRVRSGANIAVTERINVQNACERIRLLTAVTNPCGGNLEDPTNELFTAQVGAAPIDLNDLIISVSDPFADPVNGLPNVNHTWSLNGTEEAGDNTADVCGTVGLQCHRLLDVNDPNERIIYDEIVDALNQNATCNLFAIPDPGVNIAGQLPPGSRFITLLGAGGVLDGAGNIVPGSEGIQSLNLQDYSIFCPQINDIAPIYVVLGALSPSPIDNTVRGSLSNNATRDIEIRVRRQLLSTTRFNGGQGNANINQIESTSLDLGFVVNPECTPNFLFDNAALNIEDNHTISQELSSSSSFALIQTYPNPVQDEMTIEFQTSIEGKSKLEIFDLTGRKIFKEQRDISEGVQEWELKVDHLSSGVYLYQVHMLGNSLNGKFIKM